MSFFRAFARKLSALGQKPWFVLFWFPFVWFALGLAKLAIVCFQFKNLSSLFGRNDGLTSAVPLLTPAQESRAIVIRRTIKLAAHYTPWDSNCFPTAIVARILLGLYRVPYTLCFGLMREAETQEMKAHAWVTSGPCDVSGGRSFKTYTVVGSFGSQSWKTRPAE